MRIVQLTLYLLCFLGDGVQSGLYLCESDLQLAPHLALCADLGNLRDTRVSRASQKNNPLNKNTRLDHSKQNTHLVPVVGLILEATGHREGVIVVLQEGVSVLALIQSRHGRLELLQARAEVLLVPPPSGQVGLHHTAQRDVVPYVCALKEKDSVTVSFGSFQIMVILMMEKQTRTDWSPECPQSRSSLKRHKGVN